MTSALRVDADAGESYSSVGVTDLDHAVVILAGTVVFDEYVSV
jgi:hypothetical protein